MQRREYYSAKKKKKILSLDEPRGHSTELNKSVIEG